MSSLAQSLRKHNFGYVDCILYADMNLDIVDGASLWFSSMANILAQNGRVLVVMKANCKTDTIIASMRNNPNIVLLAPADLQCKSPIPVADALSLIRTLDEILPNLRMVFVRGIEAAALLLADRQFKYRTTIYITDFYTIQDGKFVIPPERTQSMSHIVRRADFFLLQTKILGDFIEATFGSPIRRVMVPPPIPDDLPYHEKRFAIAGKEEISIGYAGKIAPDWGLLEYIEWGRKLRETGVRIRLVIIGAKFHQPNKELAPTYKATMMQLFADADVEWHDVMPRADAIRLMLKMDFVWCWRPARLEDCTLELSTKLVEMAGAGTRCLCYPNQINRESLGESYPFFLRSYDDFARVIQSPPVLDGHALAKKIRAAHSIASHVRTIRDIFYSNKILPKRNVCFSGYSFRYIEPYCSYLKSNGYSILRDRWSQDDASDTGWAEKYYEQANILYCDGCSSAAAWYSKRNTEKKPLVIKFDAENLNEKFEKYVSLIAIDNVTRVIFASEKVRQKAMEKWLWPEEKTCVIDPYVFPDEYHLVEKEWSGPLRLGMAGLFPSAEGLDRALDLLEHLLELGVNAQLHLTGYPPDAADPLYDGGAYCRSVFERINGSPCLHARTVFAPWSDDLAVWYSGIDCILSCSDDASFDQTLADSVVAGCMPLIWPGETAGGGYTTDWIVPDHHAAASRIQEVMSMSRDARKKVLNNNREIVVARCGAEKIFDQLTALWQPDGLMAPDKKSEPGSLAKLGSTLLRNLKSIISPTRWRKKYNS